MIYTLANITYSLALVVIVILNVIGIQESKTVVEAFFRVVVLLIVIGMVLR